MISNNTEPHETSRKAKSLGFNFIILSGGEIISKLLTFTAFAFLARVFGPDGFGVIELALAVLFVFTQLVDFGSEKYGAVAVAQDNKQVSSLVVHVVSMRLTLAIFSFLLLAGFLLIMNKPWEVKQIILIYGLSLFLVPGLIQWVFQGLDQMPKVAVFSVVRQLIFAVLIFALIPRYKYLWLVAVFELTALTGTVLLMMFVFRKLPYRPHFKLQIDQFKSIFRQSTPIFLSQTMMALKAHLPAIVLGFMVVNNAEVGWFRASHRIVFALNTFVMLYLFNLLPSIARSIQTKTKSLNHLMHHSIRITAWSAIFIGLVGMLLAEQIVQLIYGNEFAEAAGALKIMIWMIVVFILSGHYRYILIGLGQQILDFRSTAIGAIFSVALCFLLIPKFGQIGAAWTMLFSEIMTWVFAYYFVRRRIALIPVLQHLVKPVVASGIMILTLHLLKGFEIWIRDAGGILAFIISMLLLQPSIFTDIRTFAAANN